MDMLIGFVVGLVIMDFLWAWRLGIVQALYYRIRNRLIKQQEVDILED